MNPHTHLQERKGGRFGAKLPPPAPLTAAELLSSPPSGIDGARLVRAEGQQVAEPNEAWRALFTWFEAIVDAGGTPADLDRAWHFWQPPVWAGGQHPRALARDGFDRLKARADEQTSARCKHAAVEARPHRAVRTRKYELALAEQALRDVEPAYLKRKEARDLAKAKLDAAEAAGEAA